MNPAPDSTLPRAPWSPDQGDGSFRNPVLFADYSDPDVIRVGDDYWLTSSSFSHVPGLPLLHSRDLVNWSLVGHALPSLVPSEHFSTPRHGAGVWAPALRYHAGKFWIFYPDPDFGIYVITASDPRGPWSAPFLLKAGRGLIDPCPLWDDDGRAFLVHAWAKSRSGICNRLTLHRMTYDASALLDEGTTIIDADRMPGWTTLEGPKLYRRNGWYYIFAPAGGVATGYQAVFRARDPFGPWDSRIVLAQGNSPVNGPHQGAWVDTKAGEHWFLHFQEIPALGRVVHLQPMRWTSDDWVEMGVNINESGTGEPALRHRKPALPKQPITTPAASDTFASPSLGKQWQWQANPRANWASIDPVARSLRLECVPLEHADSHWSAAHLLLQKFPAPVFTASVKLQLFPKSSGDKAGLIVFGYDYAWLGIESTDLGPRIVFRTCLKAQDGNTEAVLDSFPAPSGPLTLRVSVTADRLCTFSFSTDNKTFTPLKGDFHACSSKWVGAKVGLFASTAPGNAAAGHAVFQNFELG